MDKDTASKLDDLLAAQVLTLGLALQAKSGQRSTDNGVGEAISLVRREGPQILSRLAESQRPGSSGA